MKKTDQIWDRKSLYLRLIKVLYEAGIGHIGSCLSCMDILIAIYSKVKKKDDKFLFSKGHAAPALYVVLNKMGKINDEEMQTFHKNGTRLASHPTKHFPDEIPFPTGSLGHGLSLSCGMALKMKHEKSKNWVYCLMSDGECNSGQVWEAALFAAAKKLDNLIVIVDKNGLQAFGRTKKVLGDASSVSKWKAFGFNVLKCDGHSIDEVEKVVLKLKKMKNGKPGIVIAKTVKGKGVNFMENKLEWHYWPLDKKLYEKAVEQIERNIK